jgi:hypothetical protein
MVRGFPRDLLAHLDAIRIPHDHPIGPPSATYRSVASTNAMSYADLLDANESTWAFDAVGCVKNLLVRRLAALALVARGRSYCGWTADAARDAIAGEKEDAGPFKARWRVSRGYPPPSPCRLVAEDSGAQKWKARSVELVEQGSAPGHGHHEGGGRPSDLTSATPRPINVGGVQR